MTHPSESAIPDHDAMLGMSESDFVGLWQRVVGETPAVMLARDDMVRLLTEVHREMARGRPPGRLATSRETAAA